MVPSTWRNTEILLWGVREQIYRGLRGRSKSSKKTPLISECWSDQVVCDQAYMDLLKCLSLNTVCKLHMKIWLKNAGWPLFNRTLLPAVIQSINQAGYLKISWFYSTHFKFHMSFSIIVWKGLHFADKTRLLLDLKRAKYLAESAKTAANYSPKPKVMEDCVGSIFRRKAFPCGPHTPTLFLFAFL